MQLHWDGNNDSVDERNLSASLGTGVTPVTVDHARLARRAAVDLDEPPPAYPFRSTGRRRGRAASCTASTARSAMRISGSRRRLTSKRPRRWDRGSDGRANPGHRHGSLPAQLLHLRVRVEPVHALSRTRRIGSSISARPRVTPTSRWTGSGRGRRTSTMARCRLCVSCWMRPRRGRSSSTGVTTSSTR